MEKGYEDYQFQEDYGLKEGKSLSLLLHIMSLRYHYQAVQQSTAILELLEDIQNNKKSKFNTSDDIDRLDSLRSQISYERLLLAGKSKQKKMLLRKLKKIDGTVDKLHKDVMKLRYY